MSVSGLPLTFGARGDRHNNNHIFSAEPAMPKLKIEDVGEFEVFKGKRLVLALEQDAGIDQLHACGGNARCTTCRVEFRDITESCGRGS
jgi:ferredoxin